MHPALIAALLALLAAGPALAEQHYTARLTWSDGKHETIAAITRDDCEVGLRAIRTGLWRPRQDESGNLVVVSAECLPIDTFESGWSCIRGYNC